MIGDEKVDLLEFYLFICFLYFILNHQFVVMFWNYAKYCFKNLVFFDVLSKIMFKIYGTFL